MIFYFLISGFWIKQISFHVRFSYYCNSVKTSLPSFLVNIIDMYIFPFVAKLIADKAATQNQLYDINGAMYLADKQIISILIQDSVILEEMHVIDRQNAQINESIYNCYIRNPVKATDSACLLKLIRLSRLVGRYKKYPILA